MILLGIVGYIIIGFIVMLGIRLKENEAMPIYVLLLFWLIWPLLVILGLIYVISEVRV